MGSVSVYSGRFEESQVNDILDGRVVARKNGRDLELPEDIHIYPNNNKRLNFDHAFVVNFKGTDMNTRREFLSLWKGNWKGQQNLKQNKDIVDAAYNRARTAALRQGATEEEANRTAEVARADSFKNAMTTFLNRRGDRFKGIKIQTAEEFAKEARALKRSSRRR